MKIIKPHKDTLLALKRYCTKLTRLNGEVHYLFVQPNDFGGWNWEVDTWEEPRAGYKLVYTGKE